MLRNELVDKFDECFGISTATEEQRKKFFDWVVSAFNDAAQQRAQLKLIEEYLDDRDFPKTNGVDTYSIFGRVAFALDNAAQDSR